MDVTVIVVVKSRLVSYDEEDGVIVEMWSHGVSDDDDEVCSPAVELVLRLPFVALLVDAGRKFVAHTVVVVLLQLIEDYHPL